MPALLPVAGCQLPVPKPPRGHGVPNQCEALAAVLDGHGNVKLQAPVELEELAVHVDVSTGRNTRCFKQTGVQCSIEYIDKRSDGLDLCSSPRHHHKTHQQDAIAATAAGVAESTS